MNVTGTQAIDLGWKSPWINFDSRIIGLFCNQDITRRGLVSGRARDGTTSARRATGRRVSGMDGDGLCALVHYGRLLCLIPSTHRCLSRSMILPSSSKAIPSASNRCCCSPGGMSASFSVLIPPCEFTTRCQGTESKSKSALFVRFLLPSAFSAQPTPCALIRPPIMCEMTPYVKTFPLGIF